MKSLIKALKLEWTFLKLSAMTDLQARFNLFMHFFNDILWYTVQILLFETLYLHINSLDGWGISETRVFLGIIFTVDALQMVFFSYNFDIFFEKVAKADIDLLLLKPVNAQQILSCQRLQCGFIPNVLFSLGWLTWALNQHSGELNWLLALLTLTVIPLGLSVFYAMRLIIASFALVVSRADHLHELYFTLFRLGLRPDRLYGPGLRYIILMILPLGMIASVPSRILVEPFDIQVFGGLLAAAALLLLLSTLFWKFALKRYANA